MNISHKLLIALSTTITIALPISQCAQAASYVVNNENIDKRWPPSLYRQL